MKCPKCNSEDTKVIDKRATEEAEANRRRRECLSCGARFTTYERIETNLKVVKKDGHRVDFDENKIRRGIENSAGKRFTEEKTDALVDEVTEEIQKEHPSGEVSSSEIGEKVLAKLKDADEIAYLRFAAFHKGLENAEELQREARALRTPQGGRAECGISVIRKRDGRTAAFDRERIAKAIFAAAQAVGGKDRMQSEDLTDKVILYLNAHYSDRRPPGVEDIQDAVEKTLIENGHALTAKAYILYRQQRSKERERKELFMDINGVMDGYLQQTDWRTKENSNCDYSFSGLMLHTAGSVIANYVLNELYPAEIGEAHKKGYYHIHDLSCGVVGYCAGWSLKNLIARGFNGVPNKVDAKAAKHLDVLVNQMVNFIGCMQMEFAGAQAFSSVDTLLAPFIKTDKLTYKQAKQAMQVLVFSLNVPSRWGSQMPFSNLTFDWTVPEDMRNEKAIVGGGLMDFTYGDCQEEMNMINKAFLEVMKEGDASGRIFTFPIPTYNLTKDFDWESPNAKLLFEVTARYGTPYFQNYIGSDLDPKSVRAMCCRLNINLNELRNKGNGIFGAGEQTGSVGVVTINVNRLAFEAKTKQKFFDALGHYMILAKNSLEIKREAIERNLEQGLMPYAKSYLGTFKNHFSTIGLCGMNEACMNLLGKSIITPEGKEFAVETLAFMRDKLLEFQKETGNLYNLEATPAEGASYRLAKADKKHAPEIYTSGTDAPYLTNSTQLPVNATDDVIEALEHQDSLQTMYTGGTVFHTFLGERVSSGDACKQLVKKIAYNTHLPYFSITPTFSVCPDHGYVAGEHFTCPCGKGQKLGTEKIGVLAQ